jgi:hypothetical protein
MDAVILDQSCSRNPLSNNSLLRPSGGGRKKGCVDRVSSKLFFPQSQLRGGHDGGLRGFHNSETHRFPSNTAENNNPTRSHYFLTKTIIYQALLRALAKTGSWHGRAAFGEFCNPVRIQSCGGMSL